MASTRSSMEAAGSSPETGSAAEHQLARLMEALHRADNLDEAGAANPRRSRSPRTRAVAAHLLGVRFMISLPAFNAQTLEEGAALGLPALDGPAEETAASRAVRA
jgi:hypothetical protein